MVLAYATGCGKTPTAITAVSARLARQGGTACARELRGPRILVMCPAIVRRHWKREFSRWAGLDAHVIEHGRKRTSLTKAQREARTRAYAADVQVVSYDLADQVDAQGWDAIIFDEIHHLADSRSKQSRTARYLMLHNPGAAALGLSATLIPTELWQLWHPLYVLFGPEWGLPPKCGKISWNFVRRYCRIDRNDYGAEVGPMLPGAEESLRARLGTVAHRLTREDIADDLPPIDLSTLEMEGDVGECVTEWVKSLENDVTHAVVLVYHRELAHRLAAEALSMRPQDPTATVIVITGEMTTAKRVHRLEAAERCGNVLVIATTESIREGIRLMWAQKVLLAEWRQSPKQVLQVLGRFNSVGDRRRPQIQVLTSEESWGPSQKLLARIGAINGLIKAGGAEGAVQATFAGAEPSEAAILRQTQAMLAAGPKGADAEWLEDTGDEDEW